MMLEFLDQKNAAADLMSAIEAVTAEGRVLTPDLGGQAGTAEFTDAVLTKIAPL
jgi:isocitrate/isopropylmalate dehydrogenase